MELEIQKFLRNGGTAADLAAKYAISAKYHSQYPNLVLFKYSQIESPMGEPIVQEARGLILDSANNWQIVSYPYRKFFNYGEGHAQKIDWESATVYEKLDGSLMTVYWYDNKWNVASSGSPDASGPVNNDTSETFAKLFWDTWNSLGYQMPTDKTCCYMFELMTPRNRVIIPHGSSRIVFHGMRDILCTFEEFTPQSYIDDSGLNWEVVKTYDISNLDGVLNAAAALNPLECEGYIVVDKDFNRVKVKSPQYVALAHMKEGFSRRRMIELVRANEGSEFLTHFPEYKVLYDDIRATYDSLVKELEESYEKHKDIVAQKDFAIAIQKVRMNGCLFALRNKKTNSVREYLRDISISALENYFPCKN